MIYTVEALILWMMYEIQNEMISVPRLVLFIKRLKLKKNFIWTVLKA